MLYILYMLLTAPYGWCQIKYLSGLEQNIADYPGEVVCSAVEMGDDGENVTFEEKVLVLDKNSSAGCAQEVMQQP